MKKLIFVLVSLVSSMAFAKNYGEAGCGWGSQVIGKDGNQILAATLNATGMNTIGMTFGTSNCVDGGAVAANKEVPLFIEVNRVALASEAARGSGETLAGLASLMGCSSKSFGKALQSNYDRIFVSTDMNANGIRSEIYSVVNVNKAQNCGS